MDNTPTTLHANILDALQLDSRPETIKNYYKNWANTYDKDVQDNYFGMQFICALLDAQRKNLNPAQQTLIDVGCGTGLLGPILKSLGYRQLDGLDLCQEMINQAQKTGCYQQLYAGINIHDPLPESLQRHYDAALCLGVFTPGHVLPEALSQLANLIRPGGTLVISTRIAYYDTSDYQKISDQLQAQNVLELLHSQMNAPYREDGNAHYWVYRVL